MENMAYYVVTCVDPFCLVTVVCATCNVEKKQIP